MSVSIIADRDLSKKKKQKKKNKKQKTKTERQIAGLEWAEAQHYLHDCIFAKRRLVSPCASVQSKQSLHGTLLVAKDLKRHQTDSEDSAQAAHVILYEMRCPAY